MSGATGLAYVLVPERHKDGAIHLHGFINESLPLSDSGTMKLPGAKRPAAPARCESARGMGSRWCEGRVQHSRLDAGLFDRHTAGWFVRGGCRVLLQICSESGRKNRRKVVLPGRKVGETDSDLRGRRRPRGHGRGRCTHVHGRRTYVRNGARQRAADLCRKIWGGEFTIFGL